jgi:hypothetical protein
MQEATQETIISMHQAARREREIVAGDVDYEQMAKELLEQTRDDPDHLEDAVHEQAARLAAQDVSLRSGAEHRKPARQRIHEDALWVFIDSIERERQRLDELLSLDPEE